MSDLSNGENPRITELLAAYVDNLGPLETLLDQYDLSQQEVSDLVLLADQLGEILVEVSPSQAFIDGLYHELVGGIPGSQPWWDRVRAMSNRQKIAAGIGGLTLTAGMLLITARSLSHLLGHRHQDDTPQEAIA